ncbi:MAG: PaaI family thioesterase [Candidatus Dormibacteria bacterium]
MSGDAGSSLPPPDPESFWAMCFVCGPSNRSGLRLRFERHGDMIRTEFIGTEEHQGWPGVVHGGILSSLLDETLGRAAALSGTWTVTGRLEVRFRRPLRLGETATVSARLDRAGGRALAASGQVTLAGGVVVADARALMVPVPEAIAREAWVAFEHDPGHGS